MSEPPSKLARVVAAIRQALSGDGPVIVGPWTGEVGFELVYWIPFVRWALTSCRVPAARVIVVSRGGTSSWYSGIGMSRYVDAFDLMSPSEFVALSGETPKQSAWADDSGVELLRRVRHACGVADATQLMPHWMYRLYSPYWKGQAPLDFVEQRAIWSRVTPPRLPELDALIPSDCVAVRFYFSRSFPDTDATRRFARDIIQRLAAERPVVLMSPPFTLDDHRDYEPLPETVTSIAGAMVPATNLAVQTAVLGRAAAFVGTDGGLSYLPPLCGVPTYAFHAVPFTKRAHQLAVAHMIDRAKGAPRRVAHVSDGVPDTLFR